MILLADMEVQTKIRIPPNKNCAAAPPAALSLSFDDFTTFTAFVDVIPAKTFHYNKII